MTTPETIVRLLACRRFSLKGEKQTQAEIARAFDDEKIAFDREVRLREGGIIDFLVGTIGLEVKVGGSKREIFRQCKRYCESDQLSTLVLATNVALGFPRQINGKPCYLVSLGRTWL